MNQLPRIRPGLLRHPLDNQVLVYDSRDDRVHLLDQTTGCVLALLEEGGWTREGILAELSDRLGITPSPDLLPLAIEELRRAGVLDETVVKAEPIMDVTRRELIGKLAMTGAAALLIPTVATLTATRGYAQANSGEFGPGRPCTSGPECISGLCCGAPNGVCSNTGCPQPDGQACTTNGQCSSGSCVNGICGTGCTLGTTGFNCTTGPGSSCTQQQTDANAKCCSGVCSGTCSGTGSNRTWVGTCT